MKCLKEPVSRMADIQAAISAELTGILERLGSSAEKLTGPAREAERWPPVGPILRRQPRAPARVATRLGVHHLANFGGCPSRL